MKKITILLSFLLTTILVPAQDKIISFEDNIQLVEIKDGTDTYNDLLRCKLENATDAQQEEFRNKIRKLLSEKQECNKSYFSKKFSQKEINEIYKELSDSCIIAYSQRTISFIMEWRSKRRELNKAFEKIYDSYN